MLIHIDNAMQQVIHIAVTECIHVVVVVTGSIGGNRLVSHLLPPYNPVQLHNNCLSIVSVSATQFPFIQPFRRFSGSVQFS